MAVTLAGFGVASLAGFSAAGVWVGVAIALAVSAAGWYLGRGRVLPDLRSAAGRWARRPTLPGHPWPLLLVTLVAGAYVYQLLANAYHLLPSGLYSENQGTWADWAAHLSYAGSFAYGRNFPPMLPLDPGHHLTYPFLVDFLAASLVPLGASLTSSLELSSGLLGFAFAGVMYLAGVRLTGSRPVAALAPFLFALSGGLGFSYFFGDLQSSGLTALTHVPRHYTSMVDQNIQWLAPLLASMLPQRSTLFGFAIVPIVCALLFTAREQPGWQPFLFAGVLTGLTPAFHVHAYGTLVALAGFWALLNRRREWFHFFWPALVLGVPTVLWLLPEGGAHIRVQIGWLAAADGKHDSVFWFWIKNLGLFIPLLAIGQFVRGLLPTAWATHFAPMWLWFLVPNIWLFHPWDWDNQKFFVYWALLGSFLVAAVVVRVFRAGIVGAVAALGLLVVLMLAGGLDAARDANFSVGGYEFTDTAGLQVAAWARSNTDPKAIFLTAPEHNSAIPTLAGRRVVLGYPGWIWTYGINDWVTRQDDVQTMLQGRPQSLDLARRYGVAYVVIGPQEKQPPFAGNDVYWRANAVLAYSNAEYHVYKLG